MINFAQGSVRDALLELGTMQARSQYGTETDKVLPILLRLAERTVLEEFLDQVIANDEWLKQIAGMSYHHVLGFDKLVIMPMGPLGRVRLHVWSPSSRRGLEHPHNHRYSSHSVVVAGKLRVHIHARRDKGQKVTHYHETSASADGRWSFTRLGTTHLVTEMATDLCAGSTYSMSADTIHQICAPQELTVTLFLEMRRLRDWSDVFVRAEDLVPASQTQQPFKVSDLRDQLSRLRLAILGVQ